MIALLCLVSSRTVLHHTHFEDGVLGFGIGTFSPMCWPISSLEYFQVPSSPENWKFQIFKGSA